MALEQSNNSKKSSRNLVMVFLVMITFFAISFLTNILGAILPNAKDDFNLTLTMAGFLPFAFFIAYGIMSIPAGLMLEKYGEKKIMILSFIIASIGNFVFILKPSFPTFLFSLFVVGAAMAMLQVIINPLLRTSGGEENYSFNSVLAQLIFGLGSFISPLVFTYLVVNIKNENFSDPIIRFLASIVPPNILWVSIYCVCLLISLIMVIVVSFIKFPKVELKADEKVESGKLLVELIKNKVVIMYFFGIFVYVGTEQGFNNCISNFLKIYHGCDPVTVGAGAISNFWLSMTIGGIVGLGLLKLFDVKKVLGSFVVLTMVFLGLALLGPKQMALFSFSACGFLLSVMYPAVFSLALNSVEKNHGTFAGILCCAICGGAIIPLIIGIIGDHLGLKVSMCFLYLTLAYMLYIAIFSKPLIQNETIFNKKIINN